MQHLDIYYPIFNNSFSDIFSIFLGFILCVLGNILVQTIGLVKSRSAFYILLGFTLLFYFVSITNAIYQYFYFPPDIYAYLNLTNEGNLTDEVGFGYHLYKIIFYPLSAIGLANYYVISAINAILKIFAIVFFAKAYICYLNPKIENSQYENNYITIFAALMMLYPAFSYYTAIPLREALAMFFASYSIYNFMRFFVAKDSNSRLILFVVPALLTILLRPYFVLIFAALFLLILFQKRGLLQSFLYMAIFFILVFTVAAPILNMIGLSSLAEYASLSNIEQARNYRVLAYADGYEFVSFANPIEFVKSAIYLFFGFIFAPLIITDNPLLYQFGLLDILFVFSFISMSCLIVLKKDGYIHKRKNIFSYAILLIFAMGLIEYTVGGAIRHRMIPITIFTMLAAELLTAFIYRQKP